MWGRLQSQTLSGKGHEEMPEAWEVMELRGRGPLT